MIKPMFRICPKPTTILGMVLSNNRDAQVYLKDILESIARLEEYTNGKTEADLVPMRCSKTLLFVA